MNKKFMAILLCVMMIVTSLATSMAFAGTKGDDSAKQTTRVAKIHKLGTEEYNFGKKVTIEGYTFMPSNGGNNNNYTSIGAIPADLLRTDGKDEKTVTVIAEDGTSYYVTLSTNDGSGNNNGNGKDEFWANNIKPVNPKPVTEIVKAHFYVHIKTGVPVVEAGKMPQPAKNYYPVKDRYGSEITGEIILPPFNFKQDVEDFKVDQHWQTYFTDMKGEDVTGYITEYTLNKLNNYSIQKTFEDSASIPKDSKIIWYVVKDQPNDGAALRYHVDGYIIGTEYFKLNYNKNTDDTSVKGMPNGTDKHTTNQTVTVDSAKPTRTGYTFKGWSLNSGAGNYNDTAVESVTFDEQNITVYAMWEPKEYTVTYHANTGDTTEDASIVVPGTDTEALYNQEYALSTFEPQRRGYAFVGWGEKTDSTTPISSIKIDGNKDVYAIWKALDARTLSYDANIPDGDKDPLIGAVPTSVTPVYDGDSVPLSADAMLRDNYVFKGWAATKDGKTPIYTATISGNTTVYAIWAPAYTLTYHANAGGDTTVTGIPEAMTKLENGIVTLTGHPTRNNFVFDGWAENQNDTKVVTSVTIANENKDVYAVWKQVSNFTLRYHENADGDLVNGFPTDVTDLKTGDTPHLDDGIGITRIGFDFLGWYSEMVADDTVTFIKDVTIENSDVDVHAIWKAIPKFTVLYDANMEGCTGTVPTDEKSYYINTNANVIKGNLAKPDYEFLGWSTANDSKDLVGDTVTTSVENGVITLYGVWKEKTYKVTYDANTTDSYGGTLPTDSTEYKPNAQVIVSKDGLTRSEYTFRGWSTTSTNDKTTAVETLSIVGDTTLYAIWEQNTYTVTYNANATDYKGTVPEDANAYVKGGSATVLPQGSLIRDGYTFKGWSKSSENQTELVGETLTIDDNVILYAVWSKNETPIPPIDPIIPITPIVPVIPNPPVTPTDPTLPLPDDEYLPDDEDTNNGEIDNNQQLPDDEMLIIDQDSKTDQNEDQPKTGDNNDLGMYFGLVALAAGGILAIRRKRTEK